MWIKNGLVVLLTMTCLIVLSNTSWADERLRIVIETDAPGGDPDDEGSLVRFMLYMNEWDVEGIFGSTFAYESRTGVSGKETILEFIDAYEQVRPNLVKHANNWPTPQYLRSITHMTSEGRDVMIDILERDDPRPIWFTNWGVIPANGSVLLNALNWIKSNRSEAHYANVMSKLRFVEVYQHNNLGDAHTSELPFYMDTFWPNMDGGRWYHRFNDITSKAGGMNVGSDIRHNHGPLCARYTIDKEGDTMTFTHLIPNGLNVIGRPDYGGWAGRYSYGDIFYEVPTIWANNNRDTWNGTSHRDNTLIPWAVHMQNDFKVRADWCVTDSFTNTNHPPSPVLQGKSSQSPRIIHVNAGSTFTLTGAGSSDPDSDNLQFTWRYYKEAGNYEGHVSLSASGETCIVDVPEDAVGKELHVIMICSDKGAPALTRYQRAILHVDSAQDPSPTPDPTPNPTPDPDPTPEPIPSNHGITRQVWTGIEGRELDLLENNNQYPNTPLHTSTMTEFKAPVNTDDYYGQRLAGYLVPDVSGDYTFWIASNDSGSLRLSSDKSQSLAKEIAFTNSWVGDEDYDVYPSQKSVTISLVAGQWYYIEALMKEHKGKDHLTVAWKGPGMSNRVTIPGNNLRPLDTSSTPPPAPEPIPDPNPTPDPVPITQGITRQVWTGIEGKTLDLLEGSSRYPNSPDQHSPLGEFHSPINVDDYYGQRIVGYLVPDVTGDYTFWLASNDNGSLRLSTNDSADNAKEIAYTNSWVNNGEYNKYPSQTSTTIRLEAGKRYYIEAIMKEHKGSDHLSVAWQGPGIPGPTVIPGKVLRPLE